MTRSKKRYLLLLLALAVQRLWEVRRSQRHATALLAAGGREYAPGQYQLMKGLHAGWFLAMAGEVVGQRRPFRPALAWPAAGLLALGQSLRYAAMLALGSRWTARVVTLPGVPPVSHGIYRYLRHPNYLGVVLEIAAVPLLHSAWWTALAFSLANLLLLRARIRVEEAALLGGTPLPTNTNRDVEPDHGPRS
jgi:methyltransferase